MSLKHYSRKVNVEDKNLSPLIGRPGPIAGIVLTFFDIAIYFILKFVFYIYDIAKYAFDWMSNMIFGNFSGLIPKSFKKGKVIDGFENIHIYPIIAKILGLEYDESKIDGKFMVLKNTLK